MTNSISYPALAAALGLALAAGTSAAKAQTVITRDAAGQPVATTVITQPVQTVQTIETVRTVRPHRRPIERSVITTRRTVVSQDMMPVPVPAQPLYDVVTPPPAAVVTQTYAPYPRPLYDTVVAPTVDDTVVNADVAPLVPTVPAYRYVYEPDRILVIDPVTNIAVQSIPR
jgi:hypothetical protein